MEKRQHKCGGGEHQSPVPTAPYPSPSRSRRHNRRALCQQTGILGELQLFEGLEEATQKRLQAKMPAIVDDMVGETLREGVRKVVGLRTLIERTAQRGQ